MITNFAPTFAVALWRFLWVLAICVGLLYAASILMRLIGSYLYPQSPSQVSGFEVLYLMIVCSLLVNLSWFIDAIWHSFGKTDVQYGPITYSGVQDFGITGRFEKAINAVLTLASVAGGFFFLRGVLLLKRATINGQSSHGSDDLVWRAFTHMVGGAMLVQIPDMIDAFRTSFGLFW